MGLKNKFTLGVYGDGQLARLVTLAAQKQNISTLVYTLNSKESPCEGVATLFEGKSWDDHSGFLEFSSQCEVIMLENEFVPFEFLTQSESRGKVIFPNAKAYESVSNKLKQVLLAEKLSIKIPPYVLIGTPADLEDLQYPVMLKSLSGGYDGYGNLVVNHADELPKARTFIKDRGPALAQEFIYFDLEVAIIVVGDGKDYFTFPAVETIQENNICHFVLSPPRISPEALKKVEEQSKKIIESIHGVGIFGVEFFISGDEVIFNEIAPRPHNSAHFTIEATDYSQFDALVNLMLNKPLNPPHMVTKAAGMLNLLGTQNGPAKFEGDQKFLNHPQGKLHLYGKKNSRIGRKMGHFTLCGEDREDILSELTELRGRYKI